MTSKTDRAKIAAYAERRNGERFKITRNGEVHIFGRMPGSIVTGWWFAGFVENLLDDLSNPTSGIYMEAE